MWKIETDDIYVDLLKNVKFVPKNLRLNRVKNNSLALSTRMKGNEKFHQNDYEGAMAMYNESICFAVSGSEHLSLGYANRSNCFLKLRLYNQCLVDIELAKCNGYPERLMRKLESRKRECEECLTTSCGATTEQVLSETPFTLSEGDTLPWISPLLKREQQRPKGFTAKDDISVGQTLLIEESYVHMMQSDETNYCSSCWKRRMNYIPCPNCADTMYCSQKCANNNFHQSECEMAIHFEDHIDDIEEMKQFVENCISPKSFIGELYEPCKVKYRTFLTLPSSTTTQQISDSSKKCYIVFDAIMRSKLAEKFKTEATQRFLKHLITYHILILRSNAFMESTQYCHDDSDDTHFAQKLDLLTSYFRHSCLPNVIHLDKERVTVIKSILPIKRGDELLITYVNCDDHKDKKERNAYLQDRYGFRCKCRLCTVGVQHGLDAEQDPDFNFVAVNLMKLNESFDAVLVRDMRKRCIKFLSKYECNGICKELLFVSNCLGDILRLELNNV